MDSEIDVDINETDLIDSNGENLPDLDITEIETQPLELKRETVSESKTQQKDDSNASSTTETHKELPAEKSHNEVKESNSVEKHTSIPKEIALATNQPKRLLKLTGISLTNTQITPTETSTAKPSNILDNSAKPRMIKLNTTARSTAITNQAKSTQAAPKATNPASKTSTPTQKPKSKTQVAKTTTPPTLPGSQNNYVLTPSPVGKSENNIKQVLKPQSVESTTTATPQTESKPAPEPSKSKVVEVATSQRSNGTWRKPVRIRAGYVPPEERANKLKQKDHEEDEEEIDIMTDERDLDADSDSGQHEKGNKRVRPNQGFISRLVNSNFTFNTKVFPMSLEDKNLLNEDDGSVETIFKESTNNLMTTIDEMRRLQGIILLKHIANSYGIKIKIEEYEDSENTDISDSEVTDADSCAAKRRKLTNSMKEAVRKGRQVRIKQVQGAIGYKSS